MPRERVLGVKLPPRNFIEFRKKVMLVYVKIIN